MSVKIYNIPKGSEKDAVLLLIKQGYGFKNYGINNNDPFDTCVDLVNPSQASDVINFIQYNVKSLRGTPVNLKANFVSRDLNSIQPVPQPLPPSQPQPSSQPQRSEKVEEIRRNIRSILAAEKKGLDAMRLLNHYQELTAESLFDAIMKVGYRTVTQFCNDNLDCVDYNAWDNGTRAVFNGVADSKSAHIFEMNQQTKSRNAPNLRPIPYRFQRQFGNFVKPVIKVLEQQQKFSGALDLPDKHRRRIITVVDSDPSGLSTNDVRQKYQDMYEEPLPLSHLGNVTLKKSLFEILQLVDKIKYVNGKWVSLSSMVPEPILQDAASVVPKDPATAPEFQILSQNIVAVLKNTPEYTMSMSSLQQVVNIDTAMFGKSSTAELLDLIPVLKITGDNKTWTVHLKHKGEELSIKMLLTLFNTLNSDPNGLLISEFNTVYTRMNGRNLIPSDYGYKSLWHVFYNYPDICEMVTTQEGILLIANQKPANPEPPVIQPLSNRPGSSRAEPIPQPKRMESLIPIGDDEIRLGYKPFIEDEEFVLIYISVIKSPSEFYISFREQYPKDFQQLDLKLNGFYRIQSNRSPLALRDPRLSQVCVFNHENHYHRGIIETTSSRYVHVRSIDSGLRYDVIRANIYSLAQQFSKTPCYARRCALSEIRPFHGSTWDPDCQRIFGKAHINKYYFSSLKNTNDQIVELDVTDTHGTDDMKFGDILVAEGLAESTARMGMEPSNEPATLNDSYDVPESEDDDDWFDDWLDEMPSDAEEEEQHTRLQPPPLWEQPQIKEEPSASQFLSNLMQRHMNIS